MTVHPELAARRLPGSVEHYRSTPEFTAESVPTGLLGDHSTRAGVWGLLVVSRGEVTFHDAETGAEHDLTAGESQVIPPKSRHRVSPGEGARFHVAFYR